MKKTSTILVALSTLSLSGCFGVQRDIPVPDMTIVHQISRPTAVHIVIRKPSGEMTEAEVKVEAGWFIGSPAILLRASQEKNDDGK